VGDLRQPGALRIAVAVVADIVAAVVARIAVALVADISAALVADIAVALVADIAVALAVVLGLEMFGFVLGPQFANVVLVDDAAHPERLAECPVGVER